MKIAFFGTPEFAGKILSRILEYPEIDCRLVVSQPDKAVGRKREFIPTPVKQVALKNNIAVLQPEKIKPSLNSLPEREKQLHEKLKILDLDFIVVVAYGKIIPKEILDIPKFGCVNIHGSILPKYRGASPVQAAVRDGLKETGLTTMYMSQGMDEGDILKIAKISIDNVDTSQDIFKKFIQVGPDLLVESLKEIMSGDLQGMPQNQDEATYCGKISREDGEVLFQKQSAKKIYDTYRAYAPWPGIYTWYEGKRLVLEEIKPHPNPLLEERELASINIEGIQPLSPGGERIQEGGFKGKVGTFIKLSKNRYGIICADKKILKITRVKLEGKKSMDIVSFVNGNREVVGYTFQ